MATNYYDDGISGDGDPFAGYNDDSHVGVGFSDNVLLGVSVLGFSVMAFLVYNIIISRLKSSDELESSLGDGDGELDYEDELLKADVSTLNRAQRRARAKALMKRQRRVGNNSDQGGPADDHDDNSQGEGDETTHLPRKERQKAAKEAEKRERHQNEEERKRSNQAAEKKAQEAKKERLRQEAEQAKEDKRRQQQEKQKQYQITLKIWEIFLESPDGETSMSVDELVQELEAGNGNFSLEEWSGRFGVSANVVKDRLRELIQSGRINGILDDDQSAFVYLTHTQLSSLASLILERGATSLSDVSQETLRILHKKNCS